ncbi:ABC-2 family transporter protein [compost metagenome]
MLNVMKSEQYRWVRSKSYYFTGLMYILLMVAATIMLGVFNQSDPNFPYGNERFLYRNVLSMMGVVFLLLFIFPVILMGEDRNVLKNTLAYGYSRQTIYTGKLLVTMAGFMVFSLVVVGFSILLGSTMLVKNYENAIAEYMAMLINLLPIMIAGLTTYFCLASIMRKNSQLVIVFMLIYFLPHYVLGFLQGRFTWAAWIYNHQPMYYLFNAYEEMTYAAWVPWVVGGIYTLVFYVLGLHLFKKQDF